MSDNKAKVCSNISGQESFVCNLIRSGNRRKMISMGTWKNETQRRQMKRLHWPSTAATGEPCRSGLEEAVLSPKSLTFSHRGLYTKTSLFREKSLANRGARVLSMKGDTAVWDHALPSFIHRAPSALALVIRRQILSNYFKQDFMDQNSLKYDDPTVNKMTA